MAPPPATTLPDVLVLAGGGVIGEAWMSGLLAGLEDGAGLDMRRVELFAGTSAGAIVAARLASGRRPRRPTGRARATPGDEPVPGTGPPTLLGRVARGALHAGWVAGSPLTGPARTLAAPGAALARAALLSRAPAQGRTLAGLHERVAGWDVHFDGRLRISAVDRHRGRRVVFGAPGAPAATVADAVCASCAIPWVFAPVTIGGREYVDGGAWSVTNLDAAPTGRGTHVLCLDPARAFGGEDRRAAALRGALRLATASELQVLRRRGTRVLHLGPDPAAARAMGTTLMSPARAGAALAEGYRQGRELAR
ncbi:patatin-like phospholipase family protein [Baekduia soli]|uniref:Patatin-like phospholipase family protein n=1 Tax=Baekduia soli TaxID=496014 RepID=A0A5B8U8R5_9ACTN|nr:patatin-like phospholipase family protein [Baekduia soli]QEC49178.1 patatin-like phospholipase family protein [Baekduia soli]